MNESIVNGLLLMHGFDVAIFSSNKTIPPKIELITRGSENAFTFMAYERWLIHALNSIQVIGNHIVIIEIM